MVEAANRGEVLPLTEMWPTANVPNRGPESKESKSNRVEAGGIDLQTTAQQWGTPAAGDDTTTADLRKSRYETGRTTEYLSRQSLMWQTPHGMGNEDESGKKGGAGGGEFALQANAWPTPKGWDTKGQSQRGTDGPMDALPNMVATFPSSLPAPATSTDGDESLNSDRTSPRRWQTPCSGTNCKSKRAMSREGNSRKGGGQRSGPGLEQQATGEIAPTKRRLNPNFVAWLMGWPSQWSIARSGCGCSGMELSHYKQRMRSYLLRQLCLLTETDNATDSTTPDELPPAR